MNKPKTMPTITSGTNSPSAIVVAMVREMRAKLDWAILEYYDKQALERFNREASAKARRQRPRSPEAE